MANATVGLVAATATDGEDVSINTPSKKAGKKTMRGLDDHAYTTSEQSAYSDQINNFERIADHKVFNGSATLTQITVDPKTTVGAIVWSIKFTAENIKTLFPQITSFFNYSAFWAIEEFRMSLSVAGKTGDSSGIITAQLIPWGAYNGVAIPLNSHKLTKNKINAPAKYGFEILVNGEAMQSPLRGTPWLDRNMEACELVIIASGIPSDGIKVTFLPHIMMKIAFCHALPRPTTTTAILNNVKLADKKLSEYDIVVDDTGAINFYVTSDILIGTDKMFGNATLLQPIEGSFLVKDLDTHETELVRISRATAKLVQFPTIINNKPVMKMHLVFTNIKSGSSRVDRIKLESIDINNMNDPIIVNVVYNYDETNTLIAHKQTHSLFIRSLTNDMADFYSSKIAVKK